MKLAFVTTPVRQDAERASTVSRVGRWTSSPTRHFDEVKPSRDFITYAPSCGPCAPAIEINGRNGGPALLLSNELTSAGHSMDSMRRTRARWLPGASLAAVVGCSDPGCRAPASGIHAVRAVLREDWAGHVNVECTGRGMNRYDDAHYRQWPFVSDQEIQENAYVKSLTPAGEAAVFLSLRAECLREAGRLEEARQCYAGAAKLAPEVRLYAVLAGQAPGPLAAPLLVPSPELAPAASARVGTQVPGFGVSSVPLPEDPNPLKRLQQ